MHDIAQLCVAGRRACLWVKKGKVWLTSAVVIVLAPVA